MIDRRARLRPKDAAESYIYGDLGQSQPSILSVLRNTMGVVWNYSPIITEVMQANYETNQPVHSNSAYNNYKNTSNTTIDVQGDFYCANGTEAIYMLACMEFFRSVTKMDFGRKAAAKTVPDYAVAGAPPPILLFSGYGRYMYNDIPVIVKSVSFILGNDVDYIQVPVDSSLAQYNFGTIDVENFYSNIRQNGIQNKENYVYVPQKMGIAVKLEQQPTPAYMSKTFNLNEFKSGSLMRKGGFI